MNWRCFLGFHDSAVATSKILSSYRFNSDCGINICLRCRRFELGIHWHTADEIHAEIEKANREQKRQENELKKIEEEI